LATVLAFLTQATLALAAWDGTQQIELGDRVTARFAAAPETETHFFTFYAPDGTKLTVSWKGAKGQTLAVTVLDPELQPIDSASFLKGHKIKKLPLPTRGRHTIQVQTTAGSGRYTLTTEAKYPKEYGGKGLETPAEGNFEFDLGLPAGTSFSAKVKKAKKSAATPTLASLDGPQGPVDLGATGPTKVKKIPITATGPFTLAVAGGSGGEGATAVWNGKACSTEARRWAWVVPSPYRIHFACMSM